MSGQETHTPLDQFKISPIVELPAVFGFNISFTNSALMMVFAVLGVIAFMGLTTRKRALVPGRLQSMAEMTYEFVAGMVRDNVGHEGKKYFPFIFTLFIFILFCNLIGMVPGAFTATSHIIVTFALALLIFVGVTLIAIAKHGLHFFTSFLPAGTPWWLAPIMVLIEVFSYLSRPFSLSIRLAANMVAGHTLIKVMAGFVFALSWWGGWAPLAFITVFTGFEIFIAMLQAYIFTILTCVYLHSALHLH